MTSESIVVLRQDETERGDWWGQKCPDCGRGTLYYVGGTDPAGQERILLECFHGSLRAGCTKADGCGFRARQAVGEKSGS
jgi:hypothetical protein